MFWQVFTFELRRRFFSKALWICWAILLLKGTTDVLSAEWELMMPSRVPLNSPFGVYYLTMFSAFWCQMLAVGFMAQPILHDISTKSGPLVFSKPITNRGYFLGKYAASMIGLIFVMSGTVMCFVILPWIVNLFGIALPVPLMPTPWLHIAQAFFLWTVIGCLVFGTIHFALAALTGKIAPSYALAVFLFLIFLAFTVNYEGQEFDKPLMQIVDPIGKATTEAQIFYWSAEERTRNFLTLSSYLIYNRLLYAIVGLTAFGVALWRFDLLKLLNKSRQKSKIEKTDESVESAQISGKLTDAESRTMNFVEQFVFAIRSGWQDFIRLFSLNPFRIVIFVFVLMIPLTTMEIWYPKPEGTLLPSAIHQMKLVGVMLFVLIILANNFFVGEILGREQISGMKNLIDATPIKTWTIYLGKLFAIFLLAGFFTLLMPVLAFLVQILRGFTETNLLTFFYSTFVGMFPNLLAFALVGLILYAFLNNKNLAQILSIIFCFSVIIIHEMLIFEHRLILYALPGESAWSDFDANAVAVKRYLIIGAYWLGLSGFLSVVGYWLWSRGTETRFVLRLRKTFHRLKPVSVGLAVGLLAVFSLAGWQMYRNINLLNNYQTSAEKLAEKADYELKYSSLAEIAQPKITDAKLKIELFPSEYRADYSAEMRLQNRTDETINELHLETAENVKIASLQIDGKEIEAVSRDETHRHFVYKLPFSLAPNQTANLSASLKVAYQGFINEGINGTIQPDGTVFTAELLPRFGYDREREISKNSERKMQNLPARRSLPSVTEVAANPQKLARNLSATDDADFVTVRAEITTEADQFIVAPGKLISDQTVANRRIFVFENKTPTLWNFYCTSARYQVTRGSWKQVSIEIYHLPTHTYNIGRFIESAQFAFSQLTNDFGDYPHDVLRIAEVPNEIIEPQTSGNLIILPEKKGWLNDYRNFNTETETDYVQFITAKEIARGWWGQTAAPAEAQGYPLLVDSMPTYAALSVLEAKHGTKTALRQISLLTDSYLRKSAIEDGREPNLLEAEDEEYIENKGAIALFSLASQYGKTELNASLKRYLDGFRQRSNPPFTRADEFVASLRNEKNNQTLVQNFQTVSTYDYKLKQAFLSGDGTSGFDLKLEIEAGKFEANQTDNRVEVAMNEPLEVAVYFAETSVPQILQTPAITSGTNQINLKLGGKPVRVELDPRRLLIDRNQMDNAVTVRLQ